MTQPLIPPFTTESARAKVQKAEDAWNTRNPDIVAGAYSEDFLMHSVTKILILAFALAIVVSTSNAALPDPGMQIEKGHAALVNFRFIANNTVWTTKQAKPAIQGK